MYDPARDIFTSSDEPPSDSLVAADRSDDVPGNGQANTATATEDVPPKHTPEIAVSDKTAPPDSAPSPPKEASEDAAPMSLGKSRKRSRSPERRPERDDTSSCHRPPHNREKLSSKPAEVENVRPTKRVRSNSPKTEETTYNSPIPMTSTNLPRFARKKGGQGSARPERRSKSPLPQSARRERSRSPRPPRRSRSRSRERRFSDHGRRDRRTPPRRRSPSPLSRRRSPTPPPRSPPRKLKRPGGASRLSTAEKESTRQRLLEREQEQVRTARAEAAVRGVQDVVKQHYNAVPERGREWRKTDSRIRGLRSFNNWVKSTIIQKFSPNEDFTPGATENGRFAEGLDGGAIDADGRRRGLLILDMGCGKGGDLGKWQQAPQHVDLYVGVDPADVSIEQARDRYRQMRDGGGRGGRGGRGGHRDGRHQRTFDGYFFVKDAFGEWLGDIPLIREVGIDGGVGPGAAGAASVRWGGGGFDVVSMMFCMHYAFENEAKTRGMLRNVAGSLKKGGRLIGVIPNSDMLTDKVVAFHENMKKNKKPATAINGGGTTDSTAKHVEEDETEEGEAEEVPEWGNGIYRVRFPGKTPEDGVFRPPFGWKYSFFLDEAVEEIPEYVVPWEAFRAIAEDYNLELQYRRPFADVWKEEKDDPILGPLSERMGVRERGNGRFLVSDDEMEAASFYLAFCFYKV